MKITIVDLESVHVNPVGYDSAPNPDAQRLDLENAVLMQELMAMKVDLLLSTELMFGNKDV